jgi:hypothetical protein
MEHEQGGVTDAAMGVMEKKQSSLMDWMEHELGGVTDAAMGVMEKKQTAT